MQAFHFDSVESTNSQARRLFDEGRITGPAYVLAGEQTAGRGTRGRSWVSPAGAGLYLSVVDQPSVPSTSDLHHFTRSAALACAEVLNAWPYVRDGFGSGAVRIKPINDLYARDRKLGGILTEAIIERNEIRALISGIGINIYRAERTLPPEHVAPISLEDIWERELMQFLDVHAMALLIARRVVHWNAIVAGDQLDELESWWKRYCINQPSADPMGQ